MMKLCFQKQESLPLEYALYASAPLKDQHQTHCPEMKDIDFCMQLSHRTLHPMSLVGLPSKHETPLFSEVIHFSAQGDHFQQQIFDCFYSSDHYAMKANHVSSVHLN
ncbi:hypothetical protein V8G54_037703 [Vigna mungo]|uniref:Uncharacterized protein n=1 Tax=Vigna mungo TaxID=3915 RepID=A0AAQ3MKT3_VIGMU